MQPSVCAVSPGPPHVALWEVGAVKLVTMLLLWLLLLLRVVSTLTLTQVSRVLSNSDPSVPCLVSIIETVAG